MARYLGSGMVRGIGPKLAERIVGQFGLETFEVIEADPTWLREVPGIGVFRAGNDAGNQSAPDCIDVRPAAEPAS